MGEMFLITLKNGTLWAGKIGEGRLDSREAKGRIEDDFSDTDTHKMFSFIPYAIPNYMHYFFLS